MKNLLLKICFICSSVAGGLSFIPALRSTESSPRQYAAKVLLFDHRHVETSMSISRKELFQNSLNVVAANFVFFQTAQAAETRSIAPCKKNASDVTNCVSTASGRQLNLYAPPWTFEASPEEAMARIKGVIVADPNLELLEEDGPFIRVKAARNFYTDTLEFLVNSQDKVVIFRAEQDGEPSVSDFGAIRKELDSIRQRAKLGVMGEGITADTAPSGNGPLGQLKAFYGLQSGQGFEEVFED